MESDILYILEEMRKSSLSEADWQFMYASTHQNKWRQAEEFQLMWNHLLHWAVLDYELRHIKTVYTCGVAAQEELGNTHVDTYADVKSLKNRSTCWKSCGIQELKFFEGRVTHKGSGRYGV